MNSSNQFQSQEKLMAISCPKCGGETNYSDEQQMLHCLYCDSKFLLDDKIYKDQISIAKILELAGEAEKSKNYSEAYKYYTKILEIDIENSFAWLGKGFTAGMLSTSFNSRIEETKTCFDRVFYADPIDEANDQWSDQTNNKTPIFSTETHPYTFISQSLAIALRVLVYKYYDELGNHFTEIGKMEEMTDLGIKRTQTDILTAIQSFSSAYYFLCALKPDTYESHTGPIQIFEGTTVRSLKWF